jgi:tripartite-type tricarboxylate transporter receptor subunit TctC
MSFFLRFFLLISLNFIVYDIARAQPVSIPPMMRIIVPFSPGASTDIIARAIASQLSTRLGNSVIVEKSLAPHKQ